MEVALAVIKPEFRAARAAALAAGAAAGTNPLSAHGRKKSSSEKKEDKKLRKERKDRERVVRRAKREEAKAAELLKSGKSSHKKPATPGARPGLQVGCAEDIDRCWTLTGALPCSQLAITQIRPCQVSPRSARGHRSRGLWR